MFAIVVFLCGIVTIMLIGFIGFHTFLICKDSTTNEFAKRQTLTKFCANRFEFLTKWHKAREENKPFKPSEKALEKYHIANDLTVDMSNEDLKKRLQGAEKQHNTISNGSFFKSKTFFEALLKVWSPDTYDIDGNKKPVSLKKPKHAEKKTEEALLTDTSEANAGE